MSANFCTECGTHFDPEQHFCPNCGHPRTGDADATAATPAPPPPQAPAPVPAAAGDPGRGNRPWWIALSVLGVLAVIGVIAAVLLWPSDEAEAGEVFLIAEDAPGPDAFTDEIDVENPTTTAPTTTTTAATSTTSGSAAVVPAVSGGNPGLYGGTRNVGRCDPDQVADFLRANPDKAQAWVDALNSDPTLSWSGGSTVSVAEIGDYLDELTPVTLTTDTRVTNHGFKNGRPTTIPAVLQAGTAVLVDAWGTPRVKCNCGNPLTRAVPVTAKRTYRGTPWATWQPTQVTIIQQTTVEVNVYVLVNLSGSGYLDRPVGTTGDQDTESDYDPSGTPDPTTTTTAPPTTAAPTTEAPQPSGDYCTLAAEWLDTYFAWLASASEDSFGDTSEQIAQLDAMIAVAPNDLIRQQTQIAQDWLRNPTIESSPDLPELEAYLNDTCGLDTDG